MLPVTVLETEDSDDRVLLPISKVIVYESHR